VALDPATTSKYLHAKPILNFLKRTLRKKYKTKFTDQEICYTMDRIISEPINLDNVKMTKVRRKKKKKEAHPAIANINAEVNSHIENSSKGTNSN